MSIRLMSAAWELPLDTTPKMVLLVLCDFANDQGTCFPSVRTIARKASLSHRQCRRVMHKLEQDGWVKTLANHTGGATSKRYLINFEKITIAGMCIPSKQGQNTEGDNLSPLPPTTPVGGTLTSSQGGHSCPPNRHIPISKSTTTEFGVAPDSLVYPHGLRSPEAVVVGELISRLHDDQRQAVLDELAGVMATPGAIKSSPVSYVRELVRRAQSGHFHPARGVQVAMARQQRAEQAKADAQKRVEQKQRRQAAHSEASHRTAEAELAKLRKQFGIGLANSSDDRLPSGQASAAEGG